ncbi:hypothetical protein L498_3178, partial [Bordetella holmesii CDC-H629-BH]
MRLLTSLYGVVRKKKQVFYKKGVKAVTHDFFLCYSSPP